MYNPAQECAVGPDAFAMTLAAESLRSDTSAISTTHGFSAGLMIGVVFSI